MSIDSYQHKGLRVKLVETIRRKGISDENVLQAIAKVPRQLFMESVFVHRAYEDDAFPIGNGQTISQPYTVAFQSELLKIKKGDKVLEIGTGSGYQASVLFEMGAKVFTIERQKDLFVNAQKTLGLLGYKINFFYGDGYKGLPTYGPFDKILITAAAPEIPDELIKQLAPGGIMVIPLGRGTQTMTSIEKMPDGALFKKKHGDFAFVPMLGGTE